MDVTSPPPPAEEASVAGTTVVTAAMAGVAIALNGIMPLASAAFLVAVLVWFALPGVLFGRRLYGDWGAALLAGAAWGYLFSSLGLLGLWAAGLRDGWVLVLAPIFAFAVMWPLGIVRRWLTVPAFSSSDVAAVALVVVVVPAIIGRPYAMVGEEVPDGRAYRAYFTADFVWAMAVASEVSKGDLPPRNPYHLDDQLHYYWLMHLLPAVEYRAGLGGASLEQLLLVNAMWTAVVFAGFFYFFVRHFVSEPWAAAAACVFVLLCSSFEGLDRLWEIWRRGGSFDELRYLNIDAVGNWIYHGMKIDGLHRLLLYQPQHQIGYILGFSAMLLLHQARDCSRVFLMFLAGVFLGGSVLFSSFAAGMLGVATALYAAVRLVMARRWLALVTGAIAGAVAPAGALALINTLHYVDTAGSGNALVVFGLNGLAATRVWWTLFLNFGPVLLLAGAGGLAAARQRALSQLVPLWLILAVCTLFYFYVDVPDHDSVYVAWRASHLAFVALTPLCAYALQRLWEADRVVQRVAVAAVVFIALAAVPTVAIDIYNTQDVTNRAMGPGFRWTVVLSPAEVEALDWIRNNTRQAARVQVEPVVRDRDTWAYLPAFADRRMSAGLPTGMIPLAKYQQASDRIRSLYASSTAEAAHEIALDMCVDYLVIGPPERQAFPGLPALLDEKPYLFTPAFRNDALSIYMVRGPHPAKCLSVP